MKLENLDGIELRNVLDGMRINPDLYNQVSRSMSLRNNFFPKLHFSSGKAHFDD